MKQQIIYSKKTPIFLIPGFAGSKLIDKSVGQTTSKCSQKHKQFINLNIFDKEWEDKFQLKYDKVTGLSINDSIDVLDFGGVDGIQNLCEDCSKIDSIFNHFFKTELINGLYNYKYFDPLIYRLNKIGYIAGENLFGAPYDFRKIMIPDYLSKFLKQLKELLETSYEKNKTPAMLVAHSLGCLIVYIFLVEYCEPAWKSKYIKKFISIGGPYGGTSFALKTLMSGLPKLPLIKERYYNILQSSTGIALALPNVLGYDCEEILNNKDMNSPYSVYNYHEVIPDISYEIWKNNVSCYLSSFLMNTGVETSIITTTNCNTEVGYIYEDVHNTKMKDPINYKYMKGDGLITSKSLNIHLRKGIAFPNYRFFEINTKVQHTSILHSQELFDLLIYES